MTCLLARAADRVEEWAVHSNLRSWTASADREYNRNEKRRAYQTDRDLRDLTKERTLEHYHWKAESHDFRASEAARKRAAYRQRRGEARGSSGCSAEE